MTPANLVSRGFGRHPDQASARSAQLDLPDQVELVSAPSARQDRMPPAVQANACLASLELTTPRLALKNVWPAPLELRHL